MKMIFTTKISKKLTWFIFFNNDRIKLIDFGNALVPKDHKYQSPLVDLSDCSFVLFNLQLSIKYGGYPMISEDSRAAYSAFVNPMTSDVTMLILDEQIWLNGLSDYAKSLMLFYHDNDIGRGGHLLSLRKSLLPISQLTDLQST